ncbi:MAG: hypothetical protein IJL15_05830 [Clostridia bacterium]|nr:hypothetical protein [Clostridia bacterium]
MSKKKKELFREDRSSVNGERVSMNIALSPENKKFLKIYAAEHDTTVAAVIAKCVEKLKKETER